jgi:hypothetical protein
LIHLKSQCHVSVASCNSISSSSLPLLSLFLSTSRSSYFPLPPSSPTSSSLYLFRCCYFFVASCASISSSSFLFFYLPPSIFLFFPFPPLPPFSFMISSYSEAATSSLLAANPFQTFLFFYLPLSTSSSLFLLFSLSYSDAATSFSLLLPLLLLSSNFLPFHCASIL